MLFNCVCILASSEEFLKLNSDSRVCVCGGGLEISISKKFWGALIGSQGEEPLH